MSSHYTLYDVHNYIHLITHQIQYLKNALKTPTNVLPIEDLHYPIPNPLESLITVLSADFYLSKLTASIDLINNDYTTSHPGLNYANHLNNLYHHLNKIASDHQLTFPNTPKKPIHIEIDDYYYSQYQYKSLLLPNYQLLFQLRLLFDAFQTTQEIFHSIMANDPNYNIRQVLNTYKKDFDHLNVLAKDYNLYMCLTESTQMDYHIECLLTQRIVIVPFL